MGQTAKHVASVFRAAERQNAVLFFDEADAIAGRRFTSLSAAVRARGERGGERAAPRGGELPRRGHLRDQPGREHRSRLRAPDPHPHPVRDAERGGAGADLAGPAPRARRRRWRTTSNFRELAERYPRSGGDIKNAVLKAAQIATTEPGPDAEKRIHQRHFIQGMEEVLAAETVMSQSLFDLPGPVGSGRGPAGADVRGTGAASRGAGTGGRAAGQAGDGSRRAALVELERRPESVASCRSGSRSPLPCSRQPRWCSCLAVTLTQRWCLAACPLAASGDTPLQPRPPRSPLQVHVLAPHVLPHHQHQQP